MCDITKRYFLKILTLCFTPIAFNLTGCVLSSVLPKIQENLKFSFEQFYLLSQLIARTRNLDEIVSRKIYQLMMSEPLGTEHLQSVYDRIRTLQMQSGNGNNLVLRASDFTDSEQWFISHLLLTWYTGVYYHSRGNQHITLKHALMYQKLSQYRRPPTYCGDTPEFWARPPVPQA